VHVLSHALHYGTGVFERARCYDTTRGPAIFRWEEHLDRLYDSAKFYEMEIPFSREELTEATLELIDRQNLASCYIRPVAFYGYDMLGGEPGRGSGAGHNRSLAMGCVPRRGRPRERGRRVLRR
jgi:branched-chain amino acid aminotransferase